MSVYDMLEAATDTGSPVIQGVAAGIVTENYHKDLPGYVQVQIPVRDENTNMLRWAKVAQSYSGKEWGQHFYPEVGDQVLLAFEYGSPECAYVIASLPRDSDPFIVKTSMEQNQKKCIRTRHGNTLELVDVKDSEGDKDKAALYTSGEAHSFSMDNEKQCMVLKDKEENSKLQFSTKDGRIELYAKDKITIRAGDSITLTLNGANGTMQVKAGKIELISDSSIGLRSKDRLKAEGVQVSIQASSQLTAKSGGMAQVSGTPVKLG